MAVEISANNAKFNAAMRQSKSQFESLNKTVNMVANSMGIAFSAATVFQGLRYGATVIMDFEKRMSEVRAITGATTEEFNRLRKNAMDLGASTRFTAEQVAELQVAYGRLGFTTEEIVQVTGATLDLATATGEDLAKSADIAGSTLRGFGLNADQMTRVIDVMAASFNMSALGLDNFSEAMKYVAPVAASANLSLEETTAMLGVLADNGIRGSMAGTSLRKIISDLKGETGTLSERLQKLADKGLTGAEAMDEVGRTAYASLLILVKATERTRELEEELLQMKGAAKDAANVMQDNLAGDVTTLISAMDGFILKFSEGAGTVRELVKAMASLIQFLSKDEVFAQLKASAETAFLPMLTISKELIRRIKELNKEGEETARWLEEMNAQALKDAFGELPQVSKDWNPFGSSWDPNKGWEQPITKTVGALARLKTALKGLHPDKAAAPGEVSFGDSDISNGDILKGFGIDTDRPVDGIVKEIEYNRELHETLLDLNQAREAQLQKMMATADMAETMGSAIGNAFDQMINGEKNFAAALASITEQIITLYLQQSIAAMIKSAIADKTTDAFPFAKIAVAAAGIGAVKALFGQIGGAGSAMGSYQTPGRLPSEVGVRVDGKIRGYDMELVQDKDSYRRSRMG